MSRRWYYKTNTEEEPAIGPIPLASEPRLCSCSSSLCLSQQSSSSFSSCVSRSSSSSSRVKGLSSLPQTLHTCCEDNQCTHSLSSKQRIYSSQSEFQAQTQAQPKISITRSIRKFFLHSIIPKFLFWRKKEKKNFVFKRDCSNEDKTPTRDTPRSVMWIPGDKILLCIPSGFISEDSSSHCFDGTVLSVPCSLDSSHSKRSQAECGTVRQYTFQADQVICKRPHLVILKCFVEVEEQAAEEATDANALRVYFCLKMRYPISEVQGEVDRYTLMTRPAEKLQIEPVIVDSASQTPLQVRDLFPDMYGFIEFDMPKNEKWGGICMDYYDASVAEILYSSYHHCKTELVAKMNADYLARCEAEKKKQADVKSLGLAEKVCFSTRFLNPDSNYDQNLKGIPLLCFQGRSLYTSVVEACIQILRALHGFDWIHGDTHLSNFMLDASTLRVVLIDTERSFHSSCPIQKLLDVQEAFGHAVSLTVSMPYNKTWDMREIQGVTGILHPFNSLVNVMAVKAKANTKRNQAAVEDNKKKVLFGLSPVFKQVSGKVPVKHRTIHSKRILVFMLLPVCTCFTRQKAAERKKGCVYCRSEFNEKTARLLYSLSVKKGGFIHEIFDMALAHFVRASLSTIQIYIQCTRYVIRMNSSHARNHLMETKAAWINMLHSKVRKQDLSFTEFQCEKDMDMIDLYVQRLLFLGSYDASASVLTRAFVEYMKEKKYAELARDIKNIALPSFEDNQLYEFMVVHMCSYKLEEENGSNINSKTISAANYYHAFESCTRDTILMPSEEERVRAAQVLELEEPKKRSKKTPSAPAMTRLIIADESLSCPSSAGSAYLDHLTPDSASTPSSGFCDPKQVVVMPVHLNVSFRALEPRASHVYQ